MSLTVSTARRKNDDQYTSAALVSGVSVGATLTRDYDHFDPATPIDTLSWTASDAAKSTRTPTAGESGTAYVFLYNGSKYCYQEFTYDAALTIAETSANRLKESSGNTVSMTNVSGTLKITPNSAITGSAKVRFSVVKG